MVSSCRYWCNCQSIAKINPAFKTLFFQQKNTPHKPIPFQSTFSLGFCDFRRKKFDVVVASLNLVFWPLTELICHAFVEIGSAQLGGVKNSTQASITHTLPHTHTQRLHGTHKISRLAGWPSSCVPQPLSKLCIFPARVGIVALLGNLVLVSITVFLSAGTRWLYLNMSTVSSPDQNSRDHLLRSIITLLCWFLFVV